MFFDQCEAFADGSEHAQREAIDLEDAQLVQIIENGQRDRFNKTPELTMPAFKGQLTDEEIRDVIAYFKTLWSPEHRRYQEEQSRAEAAGSGAGPPGGGGRP